MSDYGEASTPYRIEAYSSDQTSLGQIGTDSLTTLGHIYSTVTYTYIEETSDNSTVTMSVFAGPGNFSAGSTTSVHLHNGIATFSNLVINAIGSYTLTASDGTLTSAISSSFSITGSPAKLRRVMDAEERSRFDRNAIVYLELARRFRTGLKVVG